MAGRMFYTEEEDEEMVDYVQRHRPNKEGEGSLNGNALWKCMEQQKVTRHSWQSMKCRFNKHLKHKVGNYCKVVNIDGITRAVLNTNKASNNVKKTIRPPMTMKRSKSKLLPANTSQYFSPVESPEKRQKIDAKALNSVRHMEKVTIEDGRTTETTGEKASEKTGCENANAEAKTGKENKTAGNICSNTTHSVTPKKLSEDNSKSKEKGVNKTRCYEPLDMEIVEPEDINDIYKSIEGEKTFNFDPLEAITPAVPLKRLQTLRDDSSTESDDSLDNLLFKVARGDAEEKASCSSSDLNCDSNKPNSNNDEKTLSKCSDLNCGPNEPNSHNDEKKQAKCDKSTQNGDEVDNGKKSKKEKKKSEKEKKKSEKEEICLLLHDQENLSEEQRSRVWKFLLNEEPDENRCPWMDAPTDDEKRGLVFLLREFDRVAAKWDRMDEQKQQQQTNNNNKPTTTNQQQTNNNK